MISKTKISKRTKAKRNPEIMETINLAKKNDLLDLAKKLSAPRSQYKNVNLDELDNVEGDKIIVVGKVLGSGEIKRKIRVAALGFSDSAKDSLNKAGCDVKSIKDLILAGDYGEALSLIDETMIGDPRNKALLELRVQATERAKSIEINNLIIELNSESYDLSLEEKKEN